MSWSKVKRGKKPIGWWYHKVMCEFWWCLRNRIDSAEGYYYKHLFKLDKHRINLYGERY